ncbi:hypothetical protein ACFLT1_09520, partial [Bacteroidota bacterium]
FGPFLTAQGEKLNRFPGYAFFKTIVEGRTGNDTNLYSLFVSSSDSVNQSIADVAFFCYERACWKENSITVLRSAKTDVKDTGIFMPVKLNPQTLENNFKILIEPVDD